MQSRLLRLIHITVICILYFQCVRPASICHCIRIKDCTPFKRLLLNHKPEERAVVFATVHDAGCGFQGLDPLACCPRPSRSSRFVPPNDRWIWDTSSSSKPKPVFNYEKFVAHETEMHLFDYRDFAAQRNCPQAIDDNYDEHQYFGFGSDHHFHYHIAHRPRPKPEDRPIVFPGDLRFQKSIETKGQGELMADATQQQNIDDKDAIDAILPITTSVNEPTPPESLANLLNSPDCGVSLSTRILGGEQALPGQYPWLARIAYRNRTNNRISYRCSGSLISNSYVLTAAHCVVNLVTDLELFQVRIGDDVSTAKDCALGATNCSSPNLFNIDRVLVHPNYDQPRYANDIALLNFNNSLSKFTPICLPLNNTATIARSLIGQLGVAAGWSTTAENNRSVSSSVSTSVRFIRLPIVNTTSCAITYASLSENFQQPIVITPSHLCAQGQPMNDVCRGDSGGPFMDDGTSGLLNANGRYTLIGIVAFGPTLCGVSTVPGVYTAVSSFMNWIFNSINSTIMINIT